MTTPYTRPTRGSSELCRRIVLETYGRTNPLGRLVLDCVGCGIVIEAYRANAWDADHKKTIAEGGTNTADNLVCLCTACHATKTNEHDKPRIAKGKRQRDTHHGVRRTSGSFRRAGYRYDWNSRRYVREDN